MKGRVESALKPLLGSGSRSLAAPVHVENIGSAPEGFVFGILRGAFASVSAVEFAKVRPLTRHNPGCPHLSYSQLLITLCINQTAVLLTRLIRHSAVCAGDETALLYGWDPENRNWLLALFKKGFPARSSPIVVRCICPGYSVSESSSAKRRWSDFCMAMGSDLSKSVRPMVPANSVSPVNATVSPTKQALPGE